MMRMVVMNVKQQEKKEEDREEEGEIGEQRGGNVIKGIL